VRFARLVGCSNQRRVLETASSKGVHRNLGGAGCIQGNNGHPTVERWAVKIRIQYTIMAVAWVLFVFLITVRQPWLAVCALAVFVFISYKVSRTFNSGFSVIVGQNEKHEVHFWRNQWTGRVQITVDGEMQLRKIEVGSFRRSREYELSVGTAEHHDVTFIKSRPLLFAPYRKQPIQVLVDGTVMARP
jgi:hypothetical protein